MAPSKKSPDFSKLLVGRMNRYAATHIDGIRNSISGYDPMGNCDTPSSIKETEGTTEHDSIFKPDANLNKFVRETIAEFMNDMKEHKISPEMLKSNKLKDTSLAVYTVRQLALWFRDNFKNECKEDLAYISELVSEEYKDVKANAHSIISIFSACVASLSAQMQLIKTAKTVQYTGLMHYIMLLGGAHGDKGQALTEFAQFMKDWKDKNIKAVVRAKKAPAAKGPKTAKGAARKKKEEEEPANDDGDDDDTTVSASDIADF